MVPLFALLLLVTSAGSSVSSTGFVDADAAALKARLRVEVGACAGAVVDVELPVPCDEVCVAQHAASAHVPRVVSMAVLRVGNDVDVQERVVSAAGKVELSAHRSVEPRLITIFCRPLAGAHCLIKLPDVTRAEALSKRVSAKSFQGTGDNDGGA